MSVNPDENTEAESPQYASLTAGLLARKGEALPAAAAFTAEAIAQHIPVRRLALEVERENQNSIFQQSQVAKTEDVSPDSDLPDLAPQNDATPSVKDEIDDFIVSALGTEALQDQVQVERDPGIAGSMGERASYIERELSGKDEETKEEVASEMDRVAEDLLLVDSDLNRFNTIVDEAIEQARPAEKRVLFGENVSKKVWRPSEQQGEVAKKDDTKPVDQSANQTEQEGKKGCSVDERVAAEREAIKSALTKSANASMRLDPRRYIRLNVAATKLDLSNQQVLSAALDAYLDSLDTTLFGDCACMKKGII